MQLLFGYASMQVLYLFGYIYNFYFGMQLLFGCTTFILVCNFYLGIYTTFIWVHATFILVCNFYLGTLVYNFYFGIIIICKYYLGIELLFGYANFIFVIFGHAIYRGWAI